MAFFLPSTHPSQQLAMDQNPPDEKHTHDPYTGPSNSSLVIMEGPIMEDLFARILEASPEPLELNEKELVLLAAWLKTNPAKIRLSELQCPTFKDHKLVSDKRQWRQHLEFVCEFNKGMKKAAQPKQTPLALPGIPQTDEIKPLTHAENLAYSQYLCIEKRIGKANPTDKEVYEAAVEWSKDGRIEGGVIRVSLSTWTTNVSRARKALGKLKKTSRAGRGAEASRNVINPEQI